jgi:hypothetical protein
VRGDQLDLYARRSRLLGVTGPDGRLAMLSCGTALHHGRSALAVEGGRADVARRPDPSHLARITVTDRIPVTAEAIRAVQTIEIRHTDRRSLTRIRIADGQLRSITGAVEQEGARRHLLPRDRITDLGSAVSHAQRAEAEPAWRAELAYRSGGARPSGARAPDGAIPDRPTQTTVATRDFGHAGALPVSAEHDEGATFAILYGQQDEAPFWPWAGEALSVALLADTELGVAVLPLSATVEVAATRAGLRRLLSGLGEPYPVLRLGLADLDHEGAPRAHRGCPRSRPSNRADPRDGRPRRADLSRG